MTDKRKAFKVAYCFAGLNSSTACIFLFIKNIVDIVTEKKKMTEKRQQIKDSEDVPEEEPPGNEHVQRERKFSLIYLPLMV